MRILVTGGAGFTPPLCRGFYLRLSDRIGCEAERLL